MRDNDKNNLSLLPISGLFFLYSYYHKPSCEPPLRTTINARRLKYHYKYYKYYNHNATIATMKGRRKKERKVMKEPA